MKVTICIGSACHLKGSKRVVDSIQSLIEQRHLEEKVELAGTFCTGNCGEGVCVTVDDTLFSVNPETINDFFESEIAAKA